MTNSQATGGRATEINELHLEESSGCGASALTGESTVSF